jgi:endonuclease/exonuclease/phosphatase family metal-dependent hydrolase
MIRLRVVSWNVHSWIGADRHADPGRIADVLSTLDADVIGLQEVDWRATRPDGVDPFELVARRVGMTPIPGPNLVDHRGEYGNGLLTRLPVESVEHLDLSHPRREPRGAIDARLRQGERWIRVVVTHLGLGRIERRTQVRRLAQCLESVSEGEVRLLLGDFNEWRLWGRPLAPLLGSCFTQDFRARSFPARWPLLSLDRILVAPAPRAARLTVHRPGVARLASDHLPLVLDVEWA